jgi:hypothetical protein
MITVLNNETSHMTSQDKKVAQYFIDNNITDGKVGRTNFSIQNVEANIYTMRITRNEAGWGVGSEVKSRSNVVKFQVK